MSESGRRMQTQPEIAGWPEPVGRPARPHWWSIQPAAPAAPISAKRAYAEVIGVFLLFFGASIVAGGEGAFGRYPAPYGSWALFTPAAVAELAQLSLALLVTIVMSARRGVTTRMLGLGMPRKASGKVAVAQTYRIAAWALMALVVGGYITVQLATGSLAQPGYQDGSYLLYQTMASLAAGIIEETVVLAFVVSTLRQARRPVPEIVIVAVLLRCSYHDYYGPGVVGIAIWAVLFVWLYLRLGSIIPLVVVHFLWDVTLFWGEQPRWNHAIYSGRVLAFVVVPLVAAISWVAEVMRRQASRPPATEPPPGPYQPGPHQPDLYPPGAYPSGPYPASPPHDPAGSA
jgi:Type II CAAX prenyl endopeptidase Rce1-like